MWSLNECKNGLLLDLLPCTSCIHMDKIVVEQNREDANDQMTYLSKPYLDNLIQGSQKCHHYYEIATNPTTTFHQRKELALASH
jgi:hypothetical protein